MIRWGAALAAAALVVAGSAAADETLFPDACDGPGLLVQVLGSGADLADGRAASSYLVWIDGAARVLVDTGAGSALRFAESGARAADLDAILFTQLRVEHALDLPAIIGQAQRGGRTRPLPLYGPTGNRFAPSTVTFVRALLDGTRGAYRELSGVLNPLAKDGFKLQPHDVRTRTPSVGVRRGEKEIIDMALNPRWRAAATYVTDDAAPKLAWRLRVGERGFVVGDTIADDDNHLRQLAQNADLLFVDAAVGPEAQTTATAIGRIAAQTKTKRLVLVRRSRSTFGLEEATAAAIRSHYDGPLAFADDFDCFALPAE
jgi:ribonuclease BN (tRNA processing enzyme)